MIVAGIDLSLTGTGLARAYPDRPGGPLVQTERYEPHATGLDRLRAIRQHVKEWLGQPDLVVMEGPAYRSTTQYQHELAGLWWLVREALPATRSAEVLVPDGPPRRVMKHLSVVEVTPATLKLYATGDGRARKGRMVATARLHLPWDGSGTHDEADAAWLAAIGCELAGQPLARQPTTAAGAAGRRRALTTLNRKASE